MYQNKIFFSFILLLSTIFIYYPITAMHVEALFDPFTLHEEVRSQYLYYKFFDRSLFPEDYITGYLYKGSTIYRTGFPSIYDLIIKLFYKYVELNTILKIMVFICIYITTITVAIAAWKIGGAYIAWSAATLCYILPIINYQITSAIPHMFAYPIVGMFFLAMIYGRVYLMALINILGTFLYLPVGIISGAAMAGCLLLMPSPSRGETSNWPFVKRLALLSVCGVVCLINLYPVLEERIVGYGEYIKPFEDVINYPETGSEGRFFLGVQEPISHVLIQFTSSFKGAGILIFSMTTFICFFSFSKKVFFKWLDESKHKINRDVIITYFLSVILLSIAIYILSSFHSYRFFIYSLPLLYCTILPLMVFIFIKSYTHNTKLVYQHLPNIAVMLFTFAFAFLVDTNDKTKYGYHTIPESDQVIYDFAKATPKDTSFAGMPGFYTEDFNIIDSLAFISKRPVLLSAKAHQVYYKDYLLEMRKRMNLIIDSYYSNNNEPIKLLYKEKNVDYLIIDTKYYEKEPEYFQPFKERIKKAFEEAKNNKPFILENLDKAVIKSGSIYIFDLKDLLAENNQ
jgi:hypothetical protein